MHSSSTNRSNPRRRVLLSLALATVLALGLGLARPPVTHAGGNQASGAITDELMVYNGANVALSTSIGDFISDQAGLDEPYRYFLEVGPDVDRLVVEIFDPDILQGAAAAEDTGDRDLLRSSEDTFAHYRLFDPSGNQVATRFGVGNGTSPVSDNAWETFYDSRSAGLSGGDTFEDNFSTQVYNRNDGNQNWTGSWTEENENATAGPTGGMLQVSGGELVITNFPDPAPFTNKPGIYREADLSSYVAATLTFDWNTGGTLEDSDALVIQASGDGGTTYTGLDILDNFVTGASSGTQTYDITPYIANNTRIRFRVHDLLAGSDGTNGDERVRIDNVVVRGVTIAPADTDPEDGHWELVVDMSSDVYERAGQQDELNAIGIRAHDGDSTSTGDEVNVYAHSYYSFGLNNNGSMRSYTVFPYVTEGCTLDINDFDFDSGATDMNMGDSLVPPWGSWDLTSRSTGFTASDGGSLSDNDDWLSTEISGWNSDTTADEYGLWQVDFTIEDFGSGNYAVVYFGQDDAANPNANGDGTPGPTASPEANTFRVYFPTDGDAAPPKPYVTTTVRWRGLGNGPNPPVMGSTTGFAITIAVTNPASSIGSITFNASNLVSAFIPDDTTDVNYTYVGLQAGFPTAGTVTEPVATENDTLTWNPGAIAPGNTEVLVYMVDVAPLVATDPLTVPMNGAYGSVNGTSARFIDETGNSSDTVTFSLCGLNIIAGPTAGATPVLVSSFKGRAQGNATVLEWTTAAEAGSSEFELLRHDERGQPQKITDRPLVGLVTAPQGGVYRFLDEGASPADTHTYTLVEKMTSGRTLHHGPFTVVPDWSQAPAPLPGGFAATPHPVIARTQGDSAGETPRAPRVRGQDGPLVEAVKIRLDGGGGLYRVTAAEIASQLGVPTKTVQRMIHRTELALSHRGQAVAYHRLEDGAGLDFYAPPVDSVHGDEAVYWLRLGDGLAMGRVPGDAPSADWDGVQFRDVTRFEENLRPGVLLPLDPEGDIFLWDFLRAGDAQHGTKSFTLDLSGVADSLDSGSLVLHLQGAGEGTHQLAADLGGVPLGTASVNDLEAGTVVLDLPLTALNEGNNTLTLTATGGGLVFLEAVEVAYDRLYQADSDQLLSRGDGNQRVAPDGFTSGQVRVFDLTNPQRPRTLEGVRVVGEPVLNTFRAIWEPASPTTPYFAVAEAGVRSPLEVVADQPSSLRSVANAADYLVLAPADLLGPAQALANHRTTHGLSTQVIDLEDVYDEFADGHREWTALRDFLAFAHQSWERAPRYAVLAGAGTYDWADHLGLGGNRIPVPLRGDGETLFATDVPYGDLLGNDGVPEIAVGRLPAVDASALQVLVDKILDYEALVEPTWGSQIAVAADNADAIASYSGAGDTLSQLIPRHYQVENLYLDDHPSLASARQALFDALDAGAVLLEYVGHGGVDRMAAEGLMTSADVPALSNADRLPVVLALSCHLGFHGLPGFDALGENLVLSSTGGAVAVLAPSWLSRHGEASAVGDRFLRQLFVEEEGTLGDAWKAALERARDVGVPAELLQTYQLLGDPALELQLTPDPLPTDGGCGLDCGEG